MDQLAALLQQQASAVHQPPAAGISVPDAADAHIQAARLAAANKTQERQQQANRLATAYRCAGHACCMQELRVLLQQLCPCDTPQLDAWGTGCLKQGGLSTSSLSIHSTFCW
jgi:hypothetical protein